MTGDFSPRRREGSYGKHSVHDTTSCRASHGSALFIDARPPIRITQLFTGEQPSSGIVCMIWAACAPYKWTGLAYV